MNLGDVLFHILVVLIAAKAAAEIAERVGVPAVVAEILAGVLVGPSVLHLVGEDEALLVLGEIGVLLLLLDVGLEMDLAELGAVGRAAMAVAVIGVALPFLGGGLVAAAFGHGGNTAVFMGAALTATSVGITARVFGDLRALATVEARTVLGAAVADDVLGLVILTVVVRLVNEGSVSVLGIGQVIGVAVGFLVVSGVLGLRFAPPAVRALNRVARGPGTLVAIVFAFTLGLAKLAQSAGLAPIIGAFVAGIALSRSHHVERIRRELTPVGHLFIPVFFLHIGIEADIKAMLKPEVLGLAAALLLVAAAGKILAAAGAIGSPGDKLVIGFGMLPRGEVGLIFAGIGLREGVLSDDLYAALLIVVLATTLGAPSLLRARLKRVQAGAEKRPVVMPEDGRWLTAEHGTIELHGSPPDDVALHLSLRAATLAATARPGSAVLDLAAELGRSTTVAWDATATDELLDLLRNGSPRSWRFLEVTGVLAKALPELAEAIHRRRSDVSELDPAGALRWNTVDRLQALPEDHPFTAAWLLRLEKPEWLTLAALILDACGPETVPTELAQALVNRLDLGAAALAEINLLVGERGLMRALANRADALDEPRVLQLATHVERAERATALYLLTLADGGLDAVAEMRLHELHDRVQASLARPELTGEQTRTALDARRAAVAALAADEPGVAQRATAGPRTWLLQHSPEVLVRQARLLEPLPRRDEVRVNASYDETEYATVEIAGRDQPGFLAAVTGALAARAINVETATAATWDDGGVIESFVVHRMNPTMVSDLESEIAFQLRNEPLPKPIRDARVTFDDEASPWTTICDIEALDEPGLLHRLAAAFTASGVDVRAAQVSSDGKLARDRFEVTDDRGQKLGEETKERFRAALEGVLPAGRRARLRRRSKVATQSKQSGDERETSAS